MNIPEKGYEFPPEIAPREGDVLLPKKHPSAFFGTPLVSHLIDLGADTLVVTGCTTSGCVRGSVVDGFAYNFKCVVPHDAVYDRSATSHAVNLFDMASKYADVPQAAPGPEVTKRTSSSRPGKAQNHSSTPRSRSTCTGRPRTSSSRSTAPATSDRARAETTRNETRHSERRGSQQSGYPPAMADPDCLFCKIVAGEIPSTRVDEDERTVAFMDINPATRGHLLVIPREHSADLLEVPQEDLDACARMAQKLAKKAKERLGADGVNLLNSCGKAAWQTVFHFHVHVIPRYDTDPLRLPWVPAPGNRDEIAATAQELTA